MFYKATLVTLASLILNTASTVPVWADDEDPVVTARITFPGSIGGLVLLGGHDGEYTASVELFQLIDGTWGQIELRATLRVFEDQLLGDPIGRVSEPFDSKVDEAVEVTFPGEEFSSGSLDDFMTFSALGQGGDDKVPTSHRHIVKNLLIGLGEYDAATEFNSPSHRIIARQTGFFLYSFPALHSDISRSRFPRFQFFPWLSRPHLVLFNTHYPSVFTLARESPGQ